MKRLNRESYNKQTQKSFFYFLCDCGKTVIRRSDSKSKFCCEIGCSKSLRINHGQSKTRLWNIWSGIRSRCVLGTHKSSKTYKDRGITLCTEWNTYSTFETWALSNNYTDKLTIDRININGNYEPSNCEWITRAENTKRQVEDGHTLRTKTSQYHGVHFNNQAKKYQSAILINSKKKTKVFNNEHDAARWYNSMVKEYNLRRPINILKDYQHDT